MMEAPALPMARAKRRVLILCWIMYTLSYLLRTNLSAVLDSVMASLSLTRAMAGTLGSLFFWTYAAGQVLSGQLAERMNPKHMVLIGMLASAACNLLMGAAKGYAAALIVWGLNGLFLSMIWSPVLKILTNWYAPDEYRKVSVYIHLPTTVGYLLSWGVIRLIASRLPWRVAFFVPAACAVCFLAVWLRLLAPEPPDPVGDARLPWPRRRAETRPPLSRYTLAIRFGLLYVALLAVVQGVIKESINLWGPTLLSDMAGPLSAALVSGFSVLIPIASTLGILGVGGLIKRMRENSLRVLLALFLAAMLCACLLYAVHALLPSVLLISLLMACVCGVNVIVTSFIPLGFTRYGMATQVSGALNALVYLGAGLGGSLSGLFSDRWGWNSVYILWALLCVLSLLAILFWRRQGRRQEL